MSITENDVLRKLAVVRDHAMRSIIELTSKTERFLPSQIEEVRAILSRLVLDCRRIGEWALSNRSTQPPPGEHLPQDDEEPTDPGFKRK